MFSLNPSQRLRNHISKKNLVNQFDETTMKRKNQIKVLLNIFLSLTLIR